MTEEIIDSNVAIAMFDNVWERYPPIEPALMPAKIWCEYLSKKGELKYHSSWEWIMPVAEKIRSLGYRVEIIIGVACDVFIYKIGGNPDTDKLNIIAYSNPQDAVYTAVAQFIKWYTAHIEKQPTTLNQGV